MAWFQVVISLLRGILVNGTIVQNINIIRKCIGALWFIGKFGSMGRSEIASKLFFMSHI